MYFRPLVSRTSKLQTPVTNDDKNDKKYQQKDFNLKNYGGQDFGRMTDYSQEEQAYLFSH